MRKSEKDQRVHSLIFLAPRSKKLSHNWTNIPCLGRADPLFCLVLFMVAAELVAHGRQDFVSKFVFAS